MTAADSNAGPVKKSRKRSELERHVWGDLGEFLVLQRPRMMALCRELDLFPPQLMVLRTLDRPQPMRDVAATMACDSSNLTGITDRLEERGLVQRTIDPADRRVKLLVLTEAGERQRRVIVSRLSQPPSGAVDNLSEGDLRQLHALLRKALSSAT